MTKLTKEKAELASEIEALREKQRDEIEEKRIESIITALTSALADMGAGAFYFVNHKHIHFVIIDIDVFMIARKILAGKYDVSRAIPVETIGNLYDSNEAIQGKYILCLCHTFEIDSQYIRLIGKIPIEAPGAPGD